MSDEKSSYRQIMKATSIFGGVQVYNIVIQLIRSKVIAVLLGPVGMGIMGLLTSTLSLVTSITNFGLGTSAVRDISEANAMGNRGRIKNTLSVFRTLVWGTGLLGSCLSLFLSPWLSRLTFGNYDYTWAFALLSVTLLITQLTAGQSALLQGMRQIKWLAKAGVYSSTAGLILTLPLYYFFGINGIVPALILTAIIVFIVQYYFSHKIKIQTRLLPFKQAFQMGKPMLRLGFMLSLSGLIAVAASYLVRIFIVHIGDVAEVGLYNAGFAIVSSYVGMIFTAMSTDYFPRLSAVNNDVKASNELIKQQSEVVLLLMTPILCGFLIFINPIVIILYSREFLPISEMLLWAGFGMFFKSGSWAIGYLILARGDSRMFFFSELVINIYMLALNCLGYYFLGLEGLGISFVVAYILVYLQVFLIVKIKYDFRFNWIFYTILIVNLCFILGVFLLKFLVTDGLRYILGGVLMLVSGCYSLWELNKRLALIKLKKWKHD